MSDGHGACFFRLPGPGRRLRRAVQLFLTPSRTAMPGPDAGELSLVAAEPWERRRMAGVIRKIVVDPGPHEARVDVTVEDGTASIRVRFSARRPLPLRLGAELLVDGMVRRDGTDELFVVPERWVLLDGER